MLPSVTPNVSRPPSSRVSDNVMRMRTGNSRSSLTSSASRPSHRHRNASEHSQHRAASPPLAASKRACVAVVGRETDSDAVAPDVVKHTLTIVGADEPPIAAPHVFNFREEVARDQVVFDVLFFDLVADTLRAKSASVIALHAESAHAARPGALAHLFLTQLVGTLTGEKDPLNSYLLKASAVAGARGRMFDASCTKPRPLGTALDGGKLPDNLTEFVLTSSKAVDSFFGDVAASTAALEAHLGHGPGAVEEVCVVLQLDISRSDLHSRVQYFQSRITFLDIVNPTSEDGAYSSTMANLQAVLVPEHVRQQPPPPSLAAHVLKDTYNNEFFMCAYVARDCLDARLVDDWCGAGTLGSLAHSPRCSCAFASAVNLIPFRSEPQLMPPGSTRLEKYHAEITTLQQTAGNTAAARLRDLERRIIGVRRPSQPAPAPVSRPATADPQPVTRAPSSQSTRPSPAPAPITASDRVVIGNVLPFLLDPVQGVRPCIADTRCCMPVRYTAVTALQPAALHRHRHCHLAGHERGGARQRGWRRGVCATDAAGGPAQGNGRRTAVQGRRNGAVLVRVSRCVAAAAMQD